MNWDLKRILILANLIINTVNTYPSDEVKCVINPYKDVNWDSWEQYKANFHTHTTESGADYTPSEAIDKYYSTGYKILAITDHDKITWPWNDYGRDPDSLGMLAVKGDEYSRSYHLNGFFSCTLDSANLEEGLNDIETNSGRSHINHPGRIFDPDEWGWFIPWYQNYPTCRGLEVFNKGDLYTTDRQLWDNINQNLFDSDSIFVWGFSNDDMHTFSNLYHNFQFMLMPSLTQNDLIDCIDNGAFYFCRELTATGAATVPRIDSILVDESGKTITLSCTEYDSINWVGPGSSVFGHGEVFDYSEYYNRQFIRAVIYGPYGSTYTQPFGFLTVITDPVPAVPANITTSISENVLYIRWNSSQNADLYGVYSSEYPEGAYGLETVIPDTQYIVPVSETRRFYYVTAVFGTSPEKYQVRTVKNDLK